MKTSVEITINSPKEKVWEAITNIENSAEMIQGIDKIEVLNNPLNSLVGFKWLETRTMFGKSETEEMWITDAHANNYYIAHAENHGAIYDTKMSITEQANQSVLTMEFDAKALTLVSKILSGAIGWMFKKATIKTLNSDLEDIKKFVESNR